MASIRTVQIRGVLNMASIHTVQIRGVLNMAPIHTVHCKTSSKYGKNSCCERGSK